MLLARMIKPTPRSFEPPPQRRRPLQSVRAGMARIALRRAAERPPRSFADVIADAVAASGAGPDAGEPAGTPLHSVSRLA